MTASGALLRVEESWIETERLHVVRAENTVPMPELVMQTKESAAANASDELLQIFSDKRLSILNTCAEIIGKAAQIAPVVNGV